MVDAPDFTDLRREGIASAQALSGLLWTDFNLHDPGVTLLEQYCYALTELEYRADFDVADLLTDDSGRIDFARLGISEPGQVLPTAPVTASDIALALTSRCPQVRRVLVYPGQIETRVDGNGAQARLRKTDRRGLYDIFVVPERGESEQGTIADVQRKFHEMRNLCEDIGVIGAAEPMECELHATVEIRRRHSPERVAALIYECCGRLMTDGAQRQQRSLDKVTRAQAFDAPQLLLGQGGKLAEGAELLDQFFAALNELEEVKSVRRLAFVTHPKAGENGTPTEAPPNPVDPLSLKLKRGQYRRLSEPESESDIHLTLISRGIEMRFDLAAMLKELQRRRAETRRFRQGVTTREEWQQRPAGQRRSFPHDRVGDSLPAGYRMSSDMPRAGLSEAERHAAAQLRSFLAFSDAPLANANADLANLPVLFSNDANPQKTYVTRPLDFGNVANPLTVADDRASEIAGEFDPWRDRKGRLLDYLLALYGEHFSQNTLRLHDVYHGPNERADRVLQQRSAFLQQVARLDHNRAGAPDHVSERDDLTIGAAQKLALLLGFSEPAHASSTACLTELGLELVTGSDQSSWINAASLTVPDDPLSPLVPRKRALPEISHADLIQKVDLLGSGTLDIRVFQRAALLDSYVLAEQGAGWDIFLDIDGSQLAPVQKGLTSRDQAISLANQICGMMATLNGRCETVHLVEDILLRAGTDSFEPLSLHVVLTGWSTRTAAPDFRKFAEETVNLVCPAHLRRRLVWLDHAQAAEFEILWRDWHDAYQADNNPFIDGTDQTDLVASAQKLRKFLAPEQPA